MTQDRSTPSRAESFSDGGRLGSRDWGVVDLTTCEPDPQIFNALFKAALSRDSELLRDVAGSTLLRGIAPTVLADVYVPALARKMGDMWCADTMGFAEVTIGVARLQSMLRDLGPEWRADRQGGAGAPLILLVTLRDAQHTLGAIILAGQLRRAGFSVRLALDATMGQLSDLADRLKFDAVFISASQSESLEKLRRMVDFLRKVSPDIPPVAVGGGVVDVNDDVARVVGADIATSNIDEAIRFCGLTLKNKNSAIHAPEN